MHARSRNGCEPHELSTTKAPGVAGELFLPRARQPMNSKKQSSAQMNYALHSQADSTKKRRTENIHKSALCWVLPPSIWAPALQGKVTGSVEAPRSRAPWRARGVAASHAGQRSSSPRRLLHRGTNDVSDFRILPPGVFERLNCCLKKVKRFSVRVNEFVELNRKEHSSCSVVQIDMAIRTLVVDHGER